MEPAVEADNVGGEIEFAGARPRLMSGPSAEDMEIRAEVLRGVSLTTLCRSFWRMSFFDISPCDMEPERLMSLHSETRQCESLDTFISHAWSSPGWQRYLALLTYYYWRPASLVGAAATVMLFAVDYVGLLPTYPVKPSHWWSYNSQLSPWSLIPPLVGLATLMIPTHWMIRKKVVFFDALCINQCDEALRQEGISSITGFLAKSRELLILWTPEHLHRLWCVYEVATFLGLQDDRKIIWCPIFVQGILLIQFLGIVVLTGIDTYVTCTNVSYNNPMYYAGAVGCYIPFAVVCFAMRFYLDGKMQFVEQLTQFDINCATCREASDREYVVKAIKQSYGSEAAFNRYVQGPLAQEVFAAMPTWNGSYGTMVVSVASPRLCFSFMWIVAYLRAGLPWSVLVPLIVKEFAQSLCAFPLCMKLNWIALEALAGKFKLRAADYAVTVLVGLFSYLFGFWLMDMPQEFDGMGTLAYCVALVLATWAIFSISLECRPARQHPEERLLLLPSKRPAPEYDSDSVHSV